MKNLKLNKKQSGYDWRGLITWVLVSFGLFFFDGYIDVLCAASSLGKLAVILGLLCIGGLLFDMEKGFDLKKVFLPALLIGIVLVLFTTWLIDMFGDAAILWVAYLFTAFLVFMVLRIQKPVNKKSA